ncbi:hypothetical protein [Nitrosomonas sp.]|uniref:hypothetical protein n=1 Tax=Nitrosomonas sp. TaxID=42353 RepID=UPI0026125835|nr:hypothetical protein [Nitrosomonas sp.]
MTEFFSSGKKPYTKRTDALVAADLSRNYANDGNARLGTLIALNVTPENRQATASAKPLTPEQRQACGEDVYP